MAWCVMVKGPCRGKRCDFWARVRIRKTDPDRLLEEMHDSILVCRDNGQEIEAAIQGYWELVGVKDIVMLCSEEPDLCSKIRQVEEQARDLMS